MSKHTPGPWAHIPEWLHPTAGRVAGRSPKVVADQFEVASVNRAYCKAGRDPTAEANARLVAAATDLLAACEMIEAWFVELDNIDSINGDAALAKNRNVVHAKRRLAIRAAIAKATGGAK